MKRLIASVLVILPALALAQTSTSPKKTTPVKTVTKKAAKPAAKKNSAKKVAAVAAAAGGVGAVAAASTAAASGRTLGADELAIAQRVHTGRIGCELGQHVNVSPDGRNPGYFNVTGNGFSFHMSPVATNTGVVRLEDTRAGAVWLQIANKSMLMNQKVGQRLADECMSSEQLQVAEAIKKNPPQSLLDPSGSR